MDINISSVETIVITVLAALLGLSMPLVMQSIERFDSKYRSSVVSTAFRQGWKYRYYFWMIWISIVFMLWLPWAPKPPVVLSSYFIVNHSAHILAWGSLTITLILLLLVFLDIRTFESPEKYLHKITGLTPDEPSGSNRKLTILISEDQVFNQFAALMKYSMLIGNTQLYLNCNSVLGGCIGICRRAKKEGEAVEYPDSIYNLINETLRISQRFYDELLYPALNNPQTFLSAYFDSFGTTTLSTVTSRQLWMNLIQLSKSNKPEWIKGYWVYATQYADYTVSNRIVKSSKIYEIVRFLEEGRKEEELGKDVLEQWNIHKSYVSESKLLRLFHHMFSAYLLYQGNVDLVKWTYKYTPSSLRTLLLIPKNISNILYELADIEKNPILFESNFSFFSEEGIESGYIMKEWLFRYYILTLKEQDTLYARGLTRVNPWDNDHLLSSHDFNKINFFINSLERLTNQFYPNCDYFDSIGIRIEDLQEIYEKIIDLIDNLKVILKNIVKESNISQDDLEVAMHTFKKGISSIIRILNQKGPIETANQSIIINEFPLVVSLIVKKENFVYEARSYCQNSVPTILAKMHVQAVNHYLRIFRLTPALKNINIDYSEVYQALEKLQVSISSRYVVLPVDVPMDSNRIHNVMPGLSGSGQAQILIMLKDDLPSAEINHRVETNLIAYEDNGLFVLKGESGGLLKYPLNLKFIRLIVVNSLFDGRKSELASVKPIDTYFATN